MNFEVLNNYPKYDSYKDSGVDWLGNIPESWDTEKGKWLFTKMDRPIRENDGIVTCFRDGEVTLRSNRRSEGFTNALKEHGYQGIREGDLVIHQMDAFAGAIGVSDSNGKSTPVYSVCTPRKLNKVLPEYYSYLLRNLAYSGYILSLAKGIRERSTDFRFNDFAKLNLPLPSIETQKNIVNFIEKKSNKIDEAIELKQQQIEKLNEYKQIIIQNAVTKGLDANAKMKDSGVDWVDNIPEHWDVKKLKYLGKIKNGIDYKHVEVEKGYPVIGSGGQFTFASDFLYDGEAVLLGRKGTIDKPLYIDAKFWTVDTMFYFICKKFFSTKYIYYCATTIPFLYYSTATALPSMTQSELNNHKFSIPSLNEQTEIVKFLDDFTKKFDELKSKYQTQIASLKEYKTILINQAVTGKIKVS